MKIDSKKKRVLQLCLVPYLLLVLALNVFINTGLPKLVNTWGDGYIKYDWGFCILPFLVHLKGFELRHQDHNVQWTVQVHHIHTLVQPLDLRRRKFSSLWTFGHNINFSFGFVERSKKQNQPTFAGIPGKKEHSKEEKESKSKSQKRGWDVSLSNIYLSSLRKIHFDSYTFDGDSSVKGSFSIDSGREVSVGPAHFNIYRGEASSGKRTVSNTLMGKFIVKLDAFDPNAKDLNELQFVNIDADLSMQIHELAFMNLYLRKTPWIRGHQGIGQFKSQLVIRRGQFVVPSQLELTARKFSCTLVNSHLGAKADLSWKVKEPSTALLILKLGDISVAIDRNAEPFLIADKINISLESSDLKLHDFYKRSRTNFTLKKGRLKSINFL